MYVIRTLILIFFIVLTIIYFIHKNDNNLWHAPNKTHTDNTIENSYYFNRLNKLDLIARKSSSIEHYKSKYKSALSTFTKQESILLNKLITTISTKYTYKYQRLQTIPWNFIKFKGVEENFPHTLGDIIFLPQTFFQMNEQKQIETLIHEKLHIYQRMFPIETSKLITQLGFSIWDKQEKYDNIRSNPDTNAFIYKYNNIAQAQIYISNNPTSIKDSHIKILNDSDKLWEFSSEIKQQDHPFEIMACLIAHSIVNNTMDHQEKIMLWSKEFL